MNKKRIQLKPLAEIGRGSAEIGENSVLIEVSGINGGLKAWLIGTEAVPIGNIVGGRLYREVATTNHNGILITQSGRQMLIGIFGEEKEKEQEKFEKQEKVEEEIPFKNSGFQWRKITHKKFETNSETLKFILSNRAVYEAFKKYGYYWMGENGTDCALAIPCKADEENPLAFLGNPKNLKDGFSVVCIDEKNKRFYLPNN